MLSDTTSLKTCRISPVPSVTLSCENRGAWDFMASLSVPSAMALTPMRSTGLTVGAESGSPTVNLAVTFQMAMMSSPAIRVSRPDSDNIGIGLDRYIRWHCCVKVENSKLQKGIKRANRFVLHCAFLSLSESVIGHTEIRSRREELRDDAACCVQSSFNSPHEGRINTVASNRERRADPGANACRIKGV